MSDDRDLEDLRTMLPPPHAPALTVTQSDRLELAFLTAMARPDRGERARLAVRDHLGTVVTLVLVLVAGALALTGPHSSPRAARPLAIAASPAAAAVLDQAADAAGGASVPSVREDQYVYVRSLAISNEGRFGSAPELGAPHRRELWLSQRPVVAGDGDDLIWEFGQFWPIDYAGGRVPAGLERPTTRWLATLPTDPDDLLRLLRREVAATPWGGDYGDADQAVFWQIGSMISENLVPPQVQAALLRAVMRMPGVVTADGVTDAAGRAGFGITRRAPGNGTQDVWIFDRRSHALLGTRSYFVDTQRYSASDVRTRQQLFGATAVLQRVVVDRRGERP